MKRRSAIKYFALTAGVATIPLWVDSWSSVTLRKAEFPLSEKQQAILQSLVDIIIPTTDIPGAKDLAVDKFVTTMVADCYDKETQEAFIEGLDELDSGARERYGKPFTKLNADQSVDLLKKMDAMAEGVPDNKINFVAFVKSLTIEGYMNSEYILKNLLDYEMAPARFNGSFPVEKLSTK